MIALYALGWNDVKALKAIFTDWIAEGNHVTEGVHEAIVLDVVDVDAGLLAAFDTALQTYGVAPTRVSLWMISTWH